MSILETTNSFLKKQLKIKPYEFDLYESYKYLSLSYYEYVDLKELRYAAIKKLTLNDYLIFNNTTKYYTAELLKNTNIKKLTLIFQNPTENKWHMFIFHLLSMNNTIKEIRLEFECLKYLRINKKSWSIFLESNNNRIVEIKENYFSSIDTDINKLLYSNSNLKGIDLKFPIKRDSELTSILKYVLNSGKYLNEFTINSRFSNVSQQFFDDINKSIEKAEINTLILEDLSESSIFIIDNAYLFKVETIKIDLNLRYCKIIITHLLKLSLNPLNTVKRVILYRNKGENFIDTVIETINSYRSNNNIRNIPKLSLNALDGWKEVLLNDNNETNKIFLLYACSKSMPNGTFVLNFKETGLDEDSFKDLLYTLFNKDIKLTFLEIKYDDDYIESGTTSSKSIKENKESIISKMKELYNKFKISNTHSKLKSINRLIFKLNHINYQELNPFYFTILKIINEMNIKIEKLSIDCSVAELVEFLNDNRELESLHINHIKISNAKLDKENIEKLYQFSHLIEGKIWIDFANEIDKNIKSVQLEFANIFNSKFRKKDSNFLYHDRSFLEKRFRLCKSILITENIAHYDNKEIFDNGNICIYKNIRFLDFVYNLDQEYLIDLFSFIKERQYFLREINLINEKRKNINMIVYFLIETILDNKYRKKEVICFPTQINSRKYIKKRKCRRYTLLHNILSDNKE